MPFLFDFSKCVGEVKTIEVNPKGWKTPLVVEYGLAQRAKYDTSMSVVWRLVGTTHTFTIYEQKLNFISHANYKKHFEEVLENFRTDYLNWFEDKDYENATWKYDYQRQYGKFILPNSSRKVSDQSEDNKSTHQ